MKKILLLSTGGTIASAPGSDGLKPQLTGDDLLALLPGLEQICQPVPQELLELDSTNVGPEHWQAMARAVWTAKDDYAGVVISHGTDTMAYSSAALSMMLENIDLPVVLTGAQLPIEAPNTDGRRNLLDAFTAAASGSAGVYLVFDGKIIHGEAAYKQRTVGFDAFVTVNRPLAGQVSDGRAEWADFPAPGGLAQLRDKLELKVGLLKLTPATSLEEIDFYPKQGWKGLVIEGFGAGGIPERLLPAVQRAAAQMPVVLCSQCRYDGVNLDVYDVGHQAVASGVISGGLRTPEAWVLRLMWALANQQILA